MAVRLVCRACGKRLKLPEGAQPAPSARCPKCRAVVDLTASLEASAYMATVTIPGMARPSAPGTGPGGPAGHSPPAPASRMPPRIGEDDPLPYLPDPTPVGPAAAHPHSPTAPATRAQSPGGPAFPTNNRVPQRHQPAGSQEEPLSLDDDPSTDDVPPEVVPFRVPVQVLADTLRSAGGPCFAVFVPHGVFLEHEPMRPFAYFPVGCVVESPATGELTVTFSDRRAVTLRFTGRSARPLARDARAFLAGERPAPIASDYRLRAWMLWVALIFALGLAAGPLVLSQTANLGLEFGLTVGAGFTLLGLLANALVVLFSRWSVPAQMAVMAGICGLVTGIFLFGATAYLAGRQQAVEEVHSESPPPPAPPPAPPPPQPKTVEPTPERAPSHLDRAKKHGSSALEDGSSEVTALALAPDGNTLGIGHADGTTRLWPLDQPTFEAMLPGPKADGPVTRVEFDGKSLFVFAHTARGVIPAPRNAPPAVPARIAGTPVAVSPELAGDRIRFAAVRGNTIQTRLLSVKFVQHPPTKAKGYALPGKGDETVPPGSARDPIKGAGPTFLAFTPDGRLLAGQPNGSIMIWNPAMRPEAANNDHKAAVRAWAACIAASDFATGDDKGHVALWPGKGGKTTLWSVFGGAPVTGLSFSPAGTRIAITDNTGWLVIWDPAAGKALHRVKRPAPVKAMTYGPNDNVIVLADGRTVEVWWVPELVK